MGFGHRVYKNYDPRAAIIKKTADQLLESLGHRDELLDIAFKLEQRSRSRTSTSSSASCTRTWTSIPG